MRAAQNPREKTAKPRASRAARAAMQRANRSGRLPDLSSLSDADLAELIAHAEQELSTRRDRKKAEFFVSIREQAQALGVAPEELVSALSRKQERPPAADLRAKVAPEYRNPANPSETWAGRGGKPRWMQALLAQGKTMDDFKIVP